MTKTDPEFEKRISAAASECQKLLDAFLKQLKLQHRLKKLKIFRLNTLWRPKSGNFKHRQK